MRQSSCRFKPRIENDASELFPLLVDQAAAREAFDIEDRTRSKINFYSLGFMHNLGNLQAKAAPTWLKEKLTLINNNLSARFGTNETIVTCNSYQLYSGIKTGLRPTIDQFEAGQGLYSATLPIPTVRGLGASKYLRYRYDVFEGNIPRKTEAKINDAESSDRSYIRSEPIYVINMAKIPPRYRTFQFVHAESSV